jgi:hypothetical protein
MGSDYLLCYLEERISDYGIVFVGMPEQLPESDSNNSYLSQRKA